MHFTLAGSFVHLSWNFCQKTRMIHDIKLLQISQKSLWINITFTKSIEELSRGIERWRKCHCNHNCKQGALDHYQNRVLTWDKAKQHSHCKISRTSGQFNTSLSTAATNRQQLNISCFFDLEISKKETTNTIPFYVRNLPGTGWCLHIPHWHPKAPQHCRPHHSPQRVDGETSWQCASLRQSR